MLEICDAKQNAEVFQGNRQDIMGKLYKTWLPYNKSTSLSVLVTLHNKKKINRVLPRVEVDEI